VPWDNAAARVYKNIAPFYELVAPVVHRNNAAARANKNIAPLNEHIAPVVPQDIATATACECVTAFYKYTQG